jgi:CBS domain containing-hemolysin-like protein
MDPDTIRSALLLAVALVATNAFFVAAEFSLLALRRGRVEQNGRDTERRGSPSSAVVERAEELALVAQVFSSGATLALGFVVSWLGQALLGPGPLSMAGAVALALAVALPVQVVLGEQIPKLVGAHHCSWVNTWLPSRVLLSLALVLRPLTWSLRLVLSAAVRRLGVHPGAFPSLAHTPDEIRLLVAQGHEQGVVEEDEREMIHGVFEFSDTVAREVMTPRIDIIAVPVEVTLEELVALVVQEGHSRLPVYEGSIDSVVGVLLTKDLLPLLADPRARGSAFDIRRLMREPYFVPDTKPVDDILAEFRQQSVHLAIVLDEFGGTYGLVTMEDLLEEIVGDINDEYDVAEPDFSPTPEGDVLIDGGAAISEVNERFALMLPEEDFDTIGGYVFGALGRVPVPGDVVEVSAEAGATLQVEETEDRRVLRVRLCLPSPARAPEG